MKGATLCVMLATVMCSVYIYIYTFVFVLCNKQCEGGNIMCHVGDSGVQCIYIYIYFWHCDYLCLVGMVVFGWKWFFLNGYDHAWVGMAVFGWKWFFFD